MYCRFVFLFAFLASFLAGSTQQFSTIQINVSQNSTPNEKKALLYLPPQYNKSKSYPLVIYSHGLSQAGTSIDQLYATGLPKVLKDGYRPSFDFIMVAPQSPSYSMAPGWLPGILQEASKRWNIDTNRVYLTSIDAGGWAAYGSQLNVSAGFAKKIAAIVTISATTQNINRSAMNWWQHSQTPLWTIQGALDKSYLNQNALLVNALNKVMPDLAAITVRPGIAHGGWDAVYKGQIKLEGKTIWEWLYQYDLSKTFSKPHATALEPSTLVASTASTTTSTLKQVHVNIYGGLNAYTNTAWNNWKISTDNVNNLSSGTLKYADGTSSGISAVLSNSYSIGDNSSTYGSGMAPAAVLRYTSYASTARTLSLSGLASSKSYNLELYASRNKNEGNTTLFTINGTTRTITTYNNLTSKATFSNLAPNSEGTIKVSISNGSTYNYINGFTLTENTGTTSENSTTASTSGSVRIEAENYTSMYGVRTQTTTDAGGGRNVGWIDYNDWMNYSVNVAKAGTYALKLRLAADVSGAKFQIKNSSGTVLATVAVPNTGGYQTWYNVNATIPLSAGTQTIKFQSSAAPIWNINWFELGTMPVITTSTSTSGVLLYTGTRIEAENTTNRSGVLNQTTRDFAGGLQNIFDVNNGDWMSYKVNAPVSGSYTLCFRMACDATGSRFQIKNGSGTVLTTVDVPSTGSWQAWRDVTAVVNLAAGSQTLKLQSVSSTGWNLNYFEVAKTPLNTFASYTLRPNSGTSIYLPLSLNLAHLRPGDTLNINGGAYNVIDLGNFKGSATHPVIIRNKGGQVTCKIIRLSNTPEHFRLLGNGASGVTYGFKIDGLNTTGSCLTAFGTDFEIAYVEAMHSKSGFFIKKNPTSDDPQSQYPNYLMDNIRIHHNYIHNITGEGMYIGHTGPDGGQGGNPLLPVRMRNVVISYNRVNQTSWDGIQLSNATTGNKIHHNTVTNFGTTNTYGQQAGIILGGNSEADIYDNTIKYGTGNGIQNFGFGLNKIYNNYMEKVGRNGTDRGYEGVYCNDIIIKSESRPKQQIEAYNNTILYPMPWGAIRVSGYNQNSLPATMQYNKLLLPSAPSDWQKQYFPTYVANSTISGNSLITQ